MLCFIATAIASLSGPECALGFLSTQFDLQKLDEYGTWFDGNSTMTFAQAGIYRGVEDIKEYVSFIYRGPYISTLGILREDTSLVSFDAEKRSCVLMAMRHGRFQFSEMAGNTLYEGVTITKLEWRFDVQKIGFTHVYYHPSFINQLFSVSMYTPAIDNFVCHTIHGSCPDVWAANDLVSIGECEAKLAALPLAEGDEFYVDGNTSSCRKLHAVFAAKNSNHCAHLSFKPMADPEGKFKCQESAQVPISALFSDDELATFATFVAEVGFEPDQHWRLSPCQTQADCPAAGDPEEHPTSFITGGHYTNNATCVFGTPTKRRLLFGSTPVTPKAGVCVP
mmetsp:Transcript_14319/g.33761  ORF Transcript_14319/g.33761 Transcript_14319/m.33761 type:complete len:337 (-) Transcript_14319:238-1248(-)